MHDLLGLRTGRLPKFVKQYANLRESAISGIQAYVREVQDGSFPSETQSYK